ncbi:MAG: arsenate reductase ArsC [Candidatus Methylomirabilales bacterium]
MDRPRLLFVCTGNSARSQMAEGFAKPRGIQAQSAGLEPSRVHPLATRVMSEKGIDISSHTSKPLSDELVKEADVIITLCGDAAERCPILPPGVRAFQWPLPDPVKATGSEAEVLETFRHVRDQIEDLLRQLLQQSA